jgi:hypothetical protein
MAATLLNEPNEAEECPPANVANFGEPFGRADRESGHIDGHPLVSPHNVTESEEGIDHEEN